jgi:putative redox protein
MSDWREVEVNWSEGQLFTGQDKKGHSVTLGGTGVGFSPMELVLIGLAGCTGMDVALILEKKRQLLSGFKVMARGLRREEQPRIYTEIELEYIFWGDELDFKAIQHAIRLSLDKYCSVTAMLRQSAQIVYKVMILPGDPQKTGSK